MLKSKSTEVRTPEKKMLVGKGCEIDGRKALEISSHGKTDIIYVEDLMRCLYNSN